MQDERNPSHRRKPDSFTTDWLLDFPKSPALRLRNLAAVIDGNTRVRDPILAANNLAQYGIALLEIHSPAHGLGDETSLAPATARQ